LKKFKFGYNWTKITGPLHVELHTFMIFWLLALTWLLLIVINNN